MGDNKSGDICLFITKRCDWYTGYKNSKYIKNKSKINNVFKHPKSYVEENRITEETKEEYKHKSPDMNKKKIIKRKKKGSPSPSPYAVNSTLDNTKNPQSMGVLNYGI